LIDQGQRDLAVKVYQLFNEVHPGDKNSIAFVEFEENLDRARVADAKRAASDPNALRIQVEAVMIVTLKKNGIVLPASFMTVGNTFQAKYPPQSR
jgi:hypothetical protein